MWIITYIWYIKELHQILRLLFPLNAATRSTIRVSLYSEKSTDELFSMILTDDTISTQVFFEDCNSGFS